jgi:hypothetical protein
MPVLFALFSLLFVDFTFSVPVTLQDYVQPSSVAGSSQSIYCSVYNTGGGEVGRGRTPIAVPASGNLSTTVSVGVTMISGHAASEATDYKCWFAVADGVPASTKVTSGEMRPRSGTTPVLLVSGHLTR